MPPTKTGKDIPCDECGEEIYVPKWRLESNDNYFCSNECHNKFQKNKVSKNCDYCADTMTGVPSSLNRFCSTECFGKHKTDVGVVDVECDSCGELFETHKYRTETQERCFCSDECVSSWRKEDFSGENNPRFKDGKYRGFGDNWLEVRPKVWERADGDCEWCERTKEENGRRLSVHHIIPRRKFINHDTLSVEESNFTKNLIALCQTCHQSAEFGNSYYPENGR